MTLPVLETARLIIRPLIIDDAGPLHSIFSDVEAMTWGSHAPHTTLAQTHARLEATIASPDWRAWAIALRGTATAIGTIACTQKRQGKVTEIGYSLSRAHWGCGIAKEAVSALIDQLFAEGQRRIFADTDPDNVRSIALLKRLGFTREARLRAEWETHIGVRDSLIWGLLEDEWRRDRPQI